METSGTCTSGMWIVNNGYPWLLPLVANFDYYLETKTLNDVIFKLTANEKEEQVEEEVKKLQLVSLF